MLQQAGLDSGRKRTKLREYVFLWNSRIKFLDLKCIMVQFRSKFSNKVIDMTFRPTIHTIKL